MNRNLLSRLFVALYVLLLVGVGCTKIKSTEIGTSLIPVVDNISTFDTLLEVETENFILPDSSYPRLSLTSIGGIPTLIAGQINNDPQFGKTTGSLFFHFKPSGFPYSFETTNKDSLYLDSVVLCMNWSGYLIGDTNRLQKFNVHLLEYTPRFDSSYSLRDIIPYDQLLGTRIFAPSVLNDSLYLFRQTTANQLRIRLSDDWGRQLLKLDSSAGKPFNNDSLFRRFLPGLAVVPDPNSNTGNALMGFNLSDTSSYIRIYYRYTLGGKMDTTHKSFRYGGNAGFVNNIKRNHQGSEIFNAAKPGPDSLIYIKTTPGSYAKIRVKSLNGFKATKGNVLVHNAQLVMTQVPTTGQNDDLFIAPDFLYLDYIDSIKNIRQPFLFDAFPDGSLEPAIFGGVRKSIAGPVGTINNEYRFNITRYIQGVITRNDPNFQLYLSSPHLIFYSTPALFSGLNPIAKGRVKLGGGNNRSGKKMYLRIVYSKL
ncbi:MAG: DUF4270 family protein [Sphingobacteriales bacterium]